VALLGRVYNHAGRLVCGVWLRVGSTANVREAAQLIASVFAEYQFLNLKDRKHLTRQFVKRIEVVDRHFTAVTLTLPAPDAKIRNRTEGAFMAGSSVCADTSCCDLG
jgi:hypothetical protein